MNDQKQAPKHGAPLDAYQAHILAKEAHERAYAALNPAEVSS